MDLLEALPQTYSFTLPELAPASSPGDPHGPSGEWTEGTSIFREASGLLKALVYATSYGMAQQCRGIVEGFNGCQYLLAIQCTRTLLEYAAYQNEIYYHLKQGIGEMGESDSGAYLKRSLAFVQQLSRLLAQRRFDAAALSEETPDQILKRGREVADDDKATNILTLVERLPPDGKNWLVTYNLLSEHVHPNGGSRILFLDIPETGAAPEPQRYWTVSSDVTSHKHVDYVLALLTPPIVGLCVVIELHARELLKFAGILEQTSSKSP